MEELFDRKKLLRNRYLRNYHLKIKYGISIKQKEQMMNKQNNKCSICKKDFENSKDCNVDHNHKTGKIRGLLCFKCNCGIGYLNENVKILQKAIKYLGKGI